MTDQKPKASTSDKVKIAFITVAGTVIGAVITTLGTIAVSSNGIKNNQKDIAAAKSQISTLQEQANNLANPGIPVGTIIASTLTPQEFAKAAGDPDNLAIQGSRWTLADGKDVSGTDFVSVTGKQTVPNLCGMFLRGKSNGKAAGVEEIQLGEYRPDQVGPHAHNVGTVGGTETDHGMVYDGGRGSTTNSIYTNAPYVKNSGPGIGSETIPKNVTVNYFIRIKK
jgi:hypothetical protein